MGRGGHNIAELCTHMCICRCIYAQLKSIYLIIFYVSYTHIYCIFTISASFNNIVHSALAGIVYSRK